MAVSDPAQLPATFVAAFNAKDLTAIDRLFEPGAVRVLRPGEVVTGDGRRQATSSFLALGVPIDISLRHSYVYEDTALLIGDFVIDGTRPDGERVHIEGTATDVARRGPDGLWRYIIDNPPGIEKNGQ
ncbi:YybH family protein [Streptomyces sp. NPDC007088]|uniref:YybH family protein n=1 Tax=Streptomyces sp. NPDC007088 TaxID=3364773 RepID=UPI003684AC44